MAFSFTCAVTAAGMLFRRRGQGLGHLTEMRFVFEVIRVPQCDPFSGDNPDLFEPVFLSSLRKVSDRNLNAYTPTPSKILNPLPHAGNRKRHQRLYPKPMHRSPQAFQAQGLQGLGLVYIGGAYFGGAFFFLLLLFLLRLPRKHYIPYI